LFVFELPFLAADSAGYSLIERKHDIS